VEPNRLKKICTTLGEKPLSLQLGRGSCQPLSGNCNNPKDTGGRIIVGRVLGRKARRGAKSRSRVDTL